MTFRFRRPDVRQEEDVLPAGRLLAAVGAAIAVGGILVAMAGLLVARSTAELRPSGEFPEKFIPAMADAEDLEMTLFAFPGQGTALAEAKRAEISTFRWVDRERGVVAIPIDVAMEIVAREGAERPE